MLYQITTVFLLAAAAFSIEGFKVVPAVRRASPLKVSVDPELPGQVAPLGFFDPLGLAKGTDQRTLKRWRESELKHGRLGKTLLFT